MTIKTLPVGELQCNCYLLEQNNECLIIDPGAEYPKIKALINNKKVIGILLTHSHFDHIGCVEDLINDYSIPLYDNNNLKEGMNHISTFNFEVIKTYGHTMDCLTFYFKEDNTMFTGDFLFYESIGRVDFPESNIKEMIKSINKIKTYPNNTTIYPGHGPQSTLEHEKQFNYYLNHQIN